MVAEELALKLAEKYISPGDVMADPFCGSGRLLAAACDLPGERLGFDVNPLACLLSKAKFATVEAVDIRRISASMPTCGRRERGSALIPLPMHRIVDWFSVEALRELSEIVAWLNSLRLGPEASLVVAAALSAVTRDVSYARKTGWKLHRMSATERQAPRRGDAWTLLQRRLSYCASAIERSPTPKCTSLVSMGDCTDPTTVALHAERCDVVLTSPPYGDSKSTVQYGAASELCLNIVSHLNGFNEYSMRGGDIDRNCLGGNSKEIEDERLQMFWAGRANSREAAKAARFLSALSRACASVDTLLKPGGTAVFIVARRSTGGFRLKIDEFLLDEMSGVGLELERLRHRTLKWKRAPHYINRFARSGSLEKRATGVLPTMKDEIILSFKKPVVTAGKCPSEPWHRELRGSKVLA
jgi:site-specific DNA-methyltransferase (cytosine-N4-specific)